MPMPSVSNTVRLIILAPSKRGDDEGPEITRRALGRAGSRRTLQSCRNCIAKPPELLRPQVLRAEKRRQNSGGLSVRPYLEQTCAKEWHHCPFSQIARAAPAPVPQRHGGRLRPPFHIVYVDFRTLKRTLKASYHWLAEYTRELICGTFSSLLARLSSESNTMGTISNQVIAGSHAAVVAASLLQASRIRHARWRDEHGFIFLCCRPQ